MGSKRHTGGGESDGCDVVLARIASRQHGVVAVAQLLEVGLTRRELQRRVESGHLIRMHRGVYAVGHVALPPLAREAAALLAVGPHAFLSHRSAAAVWGILPPNARAPVDVSVTRGQPRHRPGIRVHRPQDLGPDHVRRRHGLPLGDPDRTLAELRTHLSAAALERATSEALVLGLINRAPEDHHMTRSEAERRLLGLIRKAGLPRPETNVRVAGYEVDLLWRTQRLVVEVDGFRFHGHRLAFERDRAKQQALAAAGLRVSRVTWRQLDRPHRVVAHLAQALAGAAGTDPAAAVS